MVLSAITSVLHEPLFKNKILLKPDEKNGLRINSILRCDRIMTLKKETMHIHIGRLAELDLDQFKMIFKGLV